MGYLYVNNAKSKDPQDFLLRRLRVQHRGYSLRPAATSHPTGT